MKIAVIGAGVAGIVAAWHLQGKHDVTLFEQHTSIGGHTRTIVMDDGSPVDIGFIVCNDRTYPTFLRFLDDLDVKLRPTDMSFGYHCQNSGLQYSVPFLNGVFAQRANAVKPNFLGMLADIHRFTQQARRDLHDDKYGDLPLGRYVADRRFGPAFSRDYLLPIGAAIWSTSLEEMQEFPLRTLLRFFDNHGFLTLWDAPRWHTVVGGSHQYLRAFKERFRGTIRETKPIKRVRRFEDRVEVDGEVFDHAVIAAHADEALRLLDDPSPQERAILGAWRYSKNHLFLHTDDSVLPPNRRAWASWNYCRAREGDRGVSITYHMNRLQGLSGPTQYCVTLNREVRHDRVLLETTFTHPSYTLTSIAAQERLDEIQGVQRTWYCGSYFGYGFHEDGARSGYEAARKIPE